MDYCRAFYQEDIGVIISGHDVVAGGCRPALGHQSWTAVPSSRCVSLFCHEGKEVTFYLFYPFNLLPTADGSTPTHSPQLCVELRLSGRCPAGSAEGGSDGRELEKFVSDILLHSLTAWFVFIYRKQQPATLFRSSFS